MKPTACFFLHGHPINAYQDSVVKQVFAKEKLDTVLYENYFQTWEEHESQMDSVAEVWY